MSFNSQCRIYSLTECFCWHQHWRVAEENLSRMARCAVSCKTLFAQHSAREERIPPLVANEILWNIMLGHSNSSYSVFSKERALKETVRNLANKLAVFLSQIKDKTPVTQQKKFFYLYVCLVNYRNYWPSFLYLRNNLNTMTSS